MNETERIQRELISDFLSMEDAFEQYAYLIELSALLPPLAPEKKDGGPTGERMPVCRLAGFQR